MTVQVKKQYVLEGLDCANCAAKIEMNVNKVDGVQEASLNFMNKTLTIHLENEEQLNRVFEETEQLVHRLEPHVKVIEVEQRQDKKTFTLSEIDCASCALKIENSLKEIDGVHNASVDFATRKVSIETDGSDWGRVVEDAKKAVERTEPGTYFVEQSKATKRNEHQFQNKKKLAILGAGATLFAVAVIAELPFPLELFVYVVSYILVGGEVVVKAFRNMTRGQLFDENFLMTIATVGAFAIQEFPEAVAVMLFYQIGELFQSAAVNRSRKSIADLMDIRPDFANVVVNGVERKVDPEDVSIGDFIIVKPGEKIPLDGNITKGQSMVNTSALTGESLPRDVTVGEDVLAGFINMNGVLTIEVTKPFGQSTVAKVLDLVQNAASKKAPTENFITKFARYYTPAVVVVALLIAIAPPLLTAASFSDWLYRALVFLVISCPCALVISIPLGFFGGIGGASKNGILVKGSNFLEALNDVDTVVFDKTGTLTKGVFNVTNVHAVNMTEQQLLQYAAYAESYSNHPIAMSIVNAYGKDINKENISDYTEIAGHGISVKVDGKIILAGNAKLMEKEQIVFELMEQVGTVVYVAVDGVFVGSLLISDEEKGDAKKAIDGLKAVGVKKTVMLTGDHEKVGQQVATNLRLDDVYAQLLPDQKVEKLEQLQSMQAPKKKLLFVGDGINDAPVLARADIGVAMGGLGSDAAIEAADIVIMTDEPSKIVSAIKIAKRTRKIVWQNIAFALGVKGIVLLLGAGGIATMWEAVFADVGVTIIAILNAMRVMKTNNM